MRLRAFVKSMTLLDAPHGLEGQLARYLGARWGMSVQVYDLTRFHGGAARETFRFVARTERGMRVLVLRRDPVSSLIRTSRAAEFHSLRRAFDAGLPVPEPLYLETDEHAFDTPGFIMAEVPGGRAPGLFEDDPYGAARADTGQQMFETLGRLHALVPDAADCAMLAHHDAAGRLAHWKAEIKAHAIRPEPVVQAAIRWLERNLPEASGPPTLVHGDFRSGNLLVDGSSRLLAVLDWEMAHIGDPMEDLAWAMDPLWGHGNADLVAATLPPAEAIAAWEAAAGRRFAHHAWPWWRLFAGIAGLAIWISSSFEVAHHRTVDPVMTFAGFYPYRFHNAQVARLLRELGG